MRASLMRAAAGLACAAAVAACAPIVVGAVAAGTALVVTDRRTTGAQVDDQTIQLRLANELSAAFKTQPVHINVNSFDRKVLLTGEVPDEATKARAEEIARASQNVRAVVNELAIAAPSSLSDRTADTALSGRVRAAFVNTREIAFNSIEIVTERRIVYLLGLVTENEGKIAALVASKVPGVQQVVKVFDVASQEEVDRRRALAATPATAPAAPAAK
ncbi:MAG: BON domain-containing protein [Burkholderiaceae bacterium]|jgi:osmotically-inducible protein OsmY|nr:BON domain-containing protein [Burkholderiaceae bacterium]